MNTDHANSTVSAAAVAPRASAGHWHTPQLKSFGAIQDLTAGGSKYANEGDQPQGSPGWEFVRP